ncbi:MAG: App1 family protein [Leptospiraceae bacterium]|nr:App1 family protein [Leptospiraceae bacterium]
MRQLTIQFKILAFLFFLCFSSSMFGSELKEDEDVIIFPSYIYLDSTSKILKSKIHIQVFKKKEDSLKRKVFIEFLKNYIQIEDSKNSKILEERLRWFLVDNKRNKKISVTILGESYLLKETEANGHSITEISIPSEKIGQQELVEKKIKIKIISSKNNNNLYEGILFIIPEEANCVISDIDDTVKISDVRNKKNLIQNSFVNPFQTVQGMQKIYSNWQSSKVDCFVFVSASPWQIYPILSTFFIEEQFPLSLYFMKYFRMKDSSFLNLFEKPESYKFETIEPLIQEWKRVNFILVGDSGEKDPEAYAKLIRKYPDRITKVFIRKAYEENLEDRIKTVFQDIPKEKYMFFQNSNEIK